MNDGPIEIAWLKCVARKSDRKPDSIYVYIYIYIYIFFFLV